MTAASDAIDQLQAAIATIPSLRRGFPFDANHTRWVANTLAVLEEIFGQRSRYTGTFAKFTWQFHGSTIITTYELLECGHPDQVMKRRHFEAYLTQLDTAEGLLTAAVDELKRKAKNAPEPPEMAMTVAPLKFDVFLSYAEQDRELAEELKTEFARTGVSCFMAAKDLTVAIEWQDAIRDALLASAKIMLLLTPRSINRPWVLLEAGAAWALKKPIVPALVQVAPDDLVDPIRKFQARMIETSGQRKALCKELKST